MNRKKVFLLLCMILSMPAKAWIGRVLPVAWDENTKKWNILLGRDKNTNTWSDFKAVGTGTEKNGKIIALEALRDQTNSIYNFVNSQPKTPHIQDKKKDHWFHVLQVPYKSGHYLYTNARNNIKDDFTWQSIDEIIKSNQVQHKKCGTVDGHLHWFIKKELPNLLKQLKPSETLEQTQEQPPGLWPLPGDKNAVHFYHSGNDFYEFTNTYKKPVTIDGRTWISTEHYYQAGKFQDPWQTYNNGFKINNTSYVLKDLAPGKLQGIMRNYPKNQIVSNWQNINFDRMLKALWAKFAQNKDLQKLLLGTENKILIEDAGKNDAFYGAGADYTGTNHLGQMLMQIRDALLNLQENNQNIPTKLPSYFKYKTAKPTEYLIKYKLIKPKKKNEEKPLDLLAFGLVKLEE